jgi:uncharacterized damage-inducible protein DinB
MEWADAKVWASLLESESGHSDQKIRDCLYHLHMVQKAFLRIWKGVPRETPFPSFDDAPSLMEWVRANYEEIYAHIETLSDEKLSEPMDMPWADMIEKQLGRKPEGTKIGDTVLQVVLHSMYHRGQVNARLREVGVVPPLVDYIAWLWTGRPAAEWPSAHLTNGRL